MSDSTENVPVRSAPKRKLDKLGPSPTVPVTITREIIERSMPADSRSCMIAEAIKLAHPEFRKVSVDVQSIVFSDPKKRRKYSYLTPPHAQFSLLQFDQGMQPEPFELVLKRGQVTRMGGRPLGTPSKWKGIKPADRAASPMLMTDDEHKANSKAKYVKRKAEGKIKPPRIIGAGKSDAYIQGGKVPPQMNRVRVFGMRAFVGFNGGNIITPETKLVYLPPKQPPG